MKQLSICSFSLPGGREVNEDAVRSDRRGNRLVGIVADGLGGQGGGDVASRIVADEALNKLMAAPKLSPAFIREMMERINSSVLAEQFQAGCKMMSTLALAAVQGHRVLLAHLGDTRTYRFRNGRLIYCSKDHSITQTLVDSGDVHRDDMRFHETRNLLLQSLGQMETPDPEIRQGILFGNEKLLLCSDGFWEKFSDRELAKAMTHGSAQSIMDRLKREAVKRSAPDSDNISALLIG